MSPSTDLPNDEKFLEACRGVAHRFAGYGGYRGDRRKALKALDRRAPGYSEAQRGAALDVLCQVYDVARDAVKRNVLDRPDKKSRYAEFEDIDYEACVAEVDRLEPGWALHQKQVIVSWAILYGYLM